jgi:hypothetical protein
MIHFLRTKTNKTIAEVMCWVKHDHETNTDYVEVSASIDIPTYSRELIKRHINSTPTSSANSFVHAFGELDEIRGWFYEVYLMHKKNTPDTLEETNAVIQHKMLAIANMFDLLYVED